MGRIIAGSVVLLNQPVVVIDESDGQSENDIPIIIPIFIRNGGGMSEIFKD